MNRLKREKIKLQGHKLQGGFVARIDGWPANRSIIFSENERCFLDPYALSFTHTPFEEMPVPRVFSMFYVEVLEDTGMKSVYIISMARGR